MNTMIKVGESKCSCGGCGAKFYIKWNMPFLEVPKHSTEQERKYFNNGDWECPHCANLIYGTLYMCEEPVGTLKCLEVKEVYDSKNTKKSSIKKPVQDLE